MKRSLWMAVAAYGFGAASLYAQAAPGDPVAGAIFGAAAGAAVGGPHGAAVGAVVGTLAGAAADANDRYYYERGYSRTDYDDRYGRTYYEPRYVQSEPRHVERSEPRYVEREYYYAPERVYVERAPRTVYYEPGPYYAPAPVYYPPSYYYAPALIGAAIVGGLGYRHYRHHHRGGHRHWRR